MLHFHKNTSLHNCVGHVTDWFRQCIQNPMSGVQYLLLVMYRSVGQTSHSVLLLLGSNGYQVLLVSKYFRNGFSALKKNNFEVYSIETL